MKFGLKAETIERINDVFARFPQIEQAIIYGSRSKGNYKTGSDIDLVLKGHGLDLNLTNKIRLGIDDLFLPYSFDIALFNEISNPELIDHIKRRGAVFYSAKE